LANRRTGPWTDVHALALLVVELLLDAPPYGALGEAALVRAVVASDRPTPARHGVDVGPWEPVLAKALARRPSERYASPAALCAALAAALPSRPHAAVAPSAPKGVPMTTPDPFQLVGQQTLDPKFRIDRTVAEGGFGVVYAATHLTLDTQVAVKVLKTPAD